MEAPVVEDITLASYKTQEKTSRCVMVDNMRAAESLQAMASSVEAYVCLHYMLQEIQVRARAVGL